MKLQTYFEVYSEPTIAIIVIQQIQVSLFVLST